TLSLEINPERTENKQLIIANRTYTPGSSSLYLDNGELTLDYVGAQPKVTGYRTGVMLPYGQWSDLKVSYNLDSVKFIVNGQESREFSVKGAGDLTTLTVLGGFGRYWFKGLIKSVRVHHGYYIN